MRLPRRVPLAVVGAALVAGACAWNLGDLTTRDEAWFLQVTDRVAGGEALYRDVFYGATPLAVYVTLPFVWLLGAQILWVKALVVGCFAASLLLLRWIGRRSGAGALEIAAVWVALLAWSPPYRVGLYQPLATVLLLACLAATLAWRSDGAAWKLALAGALAGLAFAAKQNVGALAAAAVLVSAVPGGVPGRARAAALAAAAWAGAVALTLVPVAASGGLGRFWEYGFANKGAYAGRAGISYARGIELQYWLVRQTGSGLGDAGTAVVHAYELLLFFLVPAVLVALAAAWLRARGEDRARLATVAAFTVAATVAIAPRADTSHVVFVFPVVLAGGWLAARALVPAPRLRVAAAVLLALLVPVAVARAVWPVLELARGEKRLSDLPHARGVLVEPALENRLAGAAAALAREPGPVFLATSEAGMLYLVSGVENPTPYDYPVATTFGRGGEERLAADVERGRFAAVCVNFGTEVDLVPTRLVAAIERSLVPGEDLGSCRLYRRP